MLNTDVDEEGDLRRGLWTDRAKLRENKVLHAGVSALWNGNLGQKVCFLRETIY